MNTCMGKQGKPKYILLPDLTEYEVYQKNVYLHVYMGLLGIC
jgi:hypothetical protein